MFEAFDMPDTHESCARRNTTVSSTQALELMNNEMVLSWARALAARVRNDGGLTPESQSGARLDGCVHAREAIGEPSADSALGASWNRAGERCAGKR